MSENRRVDLVKLDENTLWKLHEKLKKLRAKETELKNDVSVKTPIARKLKPSKYQVYQAGVTRLSNRKLAANFDKSTVDSKTATKKVEPTQKSSSPQRNRNETNQRNSQNRNNTKNNRGRRLNYRNNQGGGKQEAVRKEQISDHVDVEEAGGEGFLSRHKRRQKNEDGVDEFSDEEGRFDDELAWDNYGDSGLIHTGWSPQVTNTETSSQENGEFSDEEIYKELDFDDNDDETEVVKNQTVEIEKEDQDYRKDDDPPSVATSESNKEYYKVAHSISSQSEDDVSYDEEYNYDEYEEDRIVGGVGASKPPNMKKQLYDPSNPEQPITIKRESGNRSERKPGQNYGATSGDNVFSPKYTQAHMMSQIKTNRQRNSPNSYSPHRNTSQRNSSPGYSYRNTPRRNSPPRYYGNRYQDDTHYQEIEAHSPVGRNYHYSTENLSEDEDTMASRSRARHQKSKMTELNEAERLEASLTSILSTPSFDSHEYNESLTRIRNKLKIAYEGLIVNDIEMSSNNNVEQKLWRNVYYQVIEILREQVRSCPEEADSELKINLVLLLDQGTAFYESLLENLQHKYRFSLKDILNNASARKRHSTKSGKRSKLAILSCQRMFICLGDIARYREQANHTNNYGRARHCYLQAQTLAPKNGRPYNQLAILAVKTRHKLDAVYYYVRSLAASNPILSARESLMVLFDEIRRKLDFMKQKKKESDAEKKMADLKMKDGKKGSRSNIDDASTRRWEEVWILPGTSDDNKHKITKQSSIEDDLPELQLPPQEIAKHFILLFLNLHGKLFTRIGLETFTENLGKMLRLFKAIVNNPKLMSNHRLLQLFAINLYAVLNADKLSIHDRASDSTQNQHRALQLVFSMFAIVIDEVNRKFKSESEHSDFDPFSCEELVTLLPSIKVMFDWMYANKNSWYPPSKELTSTGLDIWVSLAELCNWICEHGSTRSSVRIYNQCDEGLQEVFLSEDTQLAGFSPLGQAFSDPRFVESELSAPENKSYIQQSVRISLIRDFLEYLCGMEEPLLAYKQGRYVAVAHTRLRSWSDKSAHDESFTSIDYDIDVDYSTSESGMGQQFDGSHDNGELSELRKYRDSLQMTKDLHEKRQNQMKTSLESEEKVRLEICPEYLVPDTNCFIDYLHLIEKLVYCGKFRISTPLVVISELEGLATERKGSSAHADNVHKSAIAAVKFINDCFATNNSKFCALTQRGTELTSLRFRSEEPPSGGNNDDFILQSTHAYAQSHSKNEGKVIQGERIVRRNVVLLTDDRNLRLKALLKQDVATKSVVDFCRWVKI